MNDYELLDNLIKEENVLEDAVQYKLENMCQIRGLAAKVEYLKNLSDKLDRVQARIEREAFEEEEPTLDDLLSAFDEKDLVVWEELKQAKAKVQELEEYILAIITDDALEELYEFLEIR